MHHFWPSGSHMFQNCSRFQLRRKTLSLWPFDGLLTVLSCTIQSIIDCIDGGGIWWQILGSKRPRCGSVAVVVGVFSPCWLSLLCFLRLSTSLVYSSMFHCQLRCRIALKDQFRDISSGCRIYVHPPGMTLVWMCFFLCAFGKMSLEWVQHEGLSTIRINEPNVVYSHLADPPDPQCTIPPCLLLTKIMPSGRFRLHIRLGVFPWKMIMGERRSPYARQLRTTVMCFDCFLSWLHMECLMTV